MKHPRRCACPRCAVVAALDAGDVPRARVLAASAGISATTLRRLQRDAAERRIRDEQRRAAEARAYLAACAQHGADVLARRAAVAA